MAGAPPSRKGFALIQTLALVTGLALAVTVGMQVLVSAQRAGQKSAHETSAMNMARAGLLDALRWFNTRANQIYTPVVTMPITAFDPQNTPGFSSDPYAVDPGLGAGAPGLGLVREVPAEPDAIATDGLWGRYEVGKVTRYEPGASRITIDDSALNTGSWVLPNLATQSGYQGVVDVSAGYKLATGSVWRLKSRGYLYRRNGTAPDAWGGGGLPYYATSKAVVAQAEVQADICLLNLKDYKHALARTSTDQAANVGLTQALGVGEGIFAAMSDRVFATGAALNTFLAGGGTLSGLSMVKSCNTTDLTSPLAGTGVLVVIGNLRLPAGSSFTGYLYVSGNYAQLAPSEVQGEVVSGGTVSIGPPTYGPPRYRSWVIRKLKREIGYREVREAVSVIN